MEEIGEAIAFLFTPDIFSAFNGEYWDDMWAELKLTLFLTLCVLITWWEHHMCVTHQVLGY